MLKSNENQWEDANKNSIKKIIYKVSALFPFDLNAWFFIILLNFTIFVPVFNIKKRFSNFKKSLKSQNPLYNNNIMSIKEWG